MVLVLAGVALLLGRGTVVVDPEPPRWLPVPAGSMMMNIVMAGLLEHHGETGTSAVAEGKRPGVGLSLFAPC
jgi:hypothetical protein